MVGIFFRKIAAVAFYLICAAIIAASGFVFGIYGFGWDSRPAVWFSEIVPIPAASVNGRVIKIREINSIMGAYRFLVESGINFDFASEAGGKQLASERDQVMKAAVENAVVREIFENKKLEVTPDEFRSYYAYLLNQAGISSGAAPAEIARKFGWSENDFIKYVAIPEYRRAKLDVFFLENDSASPAYDKITRAREQILMGKTFGEVAKAYSDDEKSKYIGGEIGLISTKNLDPWQSGALAKIGTQKLGGIVAAPGGYHIFQVTGRQAEEGGARLPAPEAAADGGQEKLRLSHIFVQSDPLNSALRDALADSKVYFFY